MVGMECLENRWFGEESWRDMQQKSYAEKKKKKSIKEQLLSVTGFGLSNAPRQRTIIFCVWVKIKCLLVCLANLHCEFIFTKP